MWSVRPDEAGAGDGRTNVTPLCCWALIVLCSACASIPKGQAATDAIHFKGNQELADGELKEKLATQETSKFLGIVQGVFFDYRIFNPFVLQEDLQRVERVYRARGFYKARARAGRIFYVKPDHVRVVIEVEEGPPAITRDFAIKGIEELPAADRKILETAVRPHIEEKRRFDEDEFLKAENVLLYELRSLGFAYAEVERSARVDIPGDFVLAEMKVKLAKKARYGEIEIRGLGDLPDKKVRKALALVPGETYSQRELDDAQQAALALGVFSSVRITPQVSREPGAEQPERVPLLVEVERIKLRTVRLGLGTQLDMIRTDLHGVASWKHQNFFGGMRTFEVELKPGVVFYPSLFSSAGSSEGETDGNTTGGSAGNSGGSTGNESAAQEKRPLELLPFFRLRSELRQPGFIEGRTDAFIRGEYEMYPLLLSSEISKEAPIIGYREQRGSVGLSRSFGRKVFVSPSYTLQNSAPFAYSGDLDTELRPLLISHVELFGRLDTRDNIIAPTGGFAFSSSLQFAGGPFAGDVTDIRFAPDVRGYFPLGKRLILAARFGTGFLFPQNYGSTLGFPNGLAPPGADRATWVRDTQISFFRGFFAGGPASNRGYAPRGIGPHGVVPFFIPDANIPAICDSDPEEDPGTCRLPIGGKTLWEASLELRFPVFDPLGGVVFCDAADVAPGEVTFRFDRPHLSCGVGARYGTPVGPLRFDVGYRIPGLQTLGDDSGEGIPPTFFGVPIALALSIGEAF